jgi:hypothetical protein
MLWKRLKYLAKLHVLTLNKVRRCVLRRPINGFPRQALRVASQEEGFFRDTATTWAETQAFAAKKAS